MRKRLHILLALAMAMTLFVGIIVGQVGIPASVAYAQQIFGHVITGKLTVINDSDLRAALSVGGAATFTAGVTSDDLTASDDTTVGDDLVVGGHVRWTPQTVITVTAGGTITPTGGLQYLTAAAARGTRLVITTTVPAGTIQAFYNVGSNTITLTDTAPLVLGGNAALGAKDTLILFHNGTEWVQLSKTDN